MPQGAVNQAADILLDGKGYMLARLPQGGRAWQRTGNPDVPYQRRFAQDIGFGNEPAELDHAETWDDWSGGAGQAYRDSALANTYHWSENMDARFPRQLVHCQALLTYSADPNALGAAINDFIDIPDLSSSQPMTGAGMVVLIGHSGALPVRPTDKTASGGPVADPWANPFLDVLNRRYAQYQEPAIFGSYLYLGARGVAGSASTWFERLCIYDPNFTSTSSVEPANGFLNAGNRLWRHSAPSGSDGRSFYLQSAAAGADPLGTGNWSATLSTGDGNLGIQRTIALNDQVFLGYQDGLYAGDQTGTFYNVLPVLRNQQHVDNVRDLTIYNGAVVVPSAAGIFQYQPSNFGGARGVAFEIGPPLASTRSPIQGRFRAVKGYAAWLYAGLYTGSASYILAGRPQTQGGTDYDWHILQRLPAPCKVSRMHFDSVTTASGGTPIPTRLWVATDASVDLGGTLPVFVSNIPRFNGNPLLADPTFTANYAGSARIDLGAVHFGAIGTPKVFRAVEVWTEASSLTGTLTGQWAEIWYSLDNGTPKYLDTAATSPRSTLFFPSTPGGFVTGQSISLSLRSFTASLNVAPIYRAVVLRGALRPRSVDTITAVLRTADGVRNRQGQTLPGGATQIDALRALSRASAPVTLVDLAGATALVDVLPPIQEQEVWQDGVDYPEIAATVKLAVLEFSGAGLTPGVIGRLTPYTVGQLTPYTVGSLAGI